MKRILIILLLAASQWAAGQSLLVPAPNIVDPKWLADRSYEMKWSMLRDTVRMEIGMITTELQNKNGLLTVITEVKMKQSGAPWKDSTVAEIGTLKPIYHSSFNAKRDMVLRYGTSVTGYYDDKAKHQKTAIQDTINTSYFDSNLYPQLITWLPLKVGYTSEIALYDYNSPEKSGVLKAYVKDVKAGIYESSKSGKHKVWVVTVTDELSPSVSTYFVDVADRRLWKQEILVKGGKMEMILVEN
jgi:hypothetical protein